METVYRVMDALLPFELFRYAFMKNALLALLLLTPLLALLGTMAVNQRMAFFSDALGHSALAGLGLGVLLGLSNVTLILVLFGTALSSCMIFPLSTNGQASAVGTIVSAGYGFVCGAYMPVSSFSPVLQKVIAFLPGTYGTALLRCHAMRGVFAEMRRIGFPAEVVSGIRDSGDCNLYFFGHAVSTGAMYAIMLGSIAALIGLYVLLNRPGHGEKRHG